MKQVIVWILITYKKLISPLLEALFGKACKYEVTCGEFAVKSVDKYGVIKGGNLAFRRFLTCK